MLFAVVLGTSFVLESPHVRAQDETGIDATVRANPLHIRIYTLGDTIKGCGPVLAFVEIRNLADKPLTVLHESLAAAPPGMRVVGTLPLHARVLRAKHAGVSVWILQPLHAGDTALVASVRSTVRGESFTSESAAKVLRLRSQCTRKG